MSTANYQPSSNKNTEMQSIAEKDNFNKEDIKNLRTAKSRYNQRIGKGRNGQTFSPLKSPSPLTSKFNSMRSNRNCREIEDCDERRNLDESLKSKKKASERMFIYIIPDGIDILKDTYRICKHDIQCYISNMLPDKEEIEKKYPYLTLKEKISMLMPSEQIREQVFNQFLTDVGERMGIKGDNLHFFDMNMNKINDLMELHEGTKVFIISEDEECHGVTGLEYIEQEKYIKDENKQKANKAFVEACYNWICDHKVTESGSNENEILKKNKAMHFKIKNKKLPIIKPKNYEDHEF